MCGQEHLSNASTNAVPDATKNSSANHNHDVNNSNNNNGNNNNNKWWKCDYHWSDDDDNNNTSTIVDFDIDIIVGGDVDDIFIRFRKHFEFANP
jgi:hypothetical protein